MSHRIKALTVTLEPNVRDDDAEQIITAIKMIRRVAAVDTHVANFDHHIAVTQARLELSKKLWEALKDT